MPIKPWGYDLNPLSPTYGLQKQADDGSALTGISANATQIQGQNIDVGPATNHQVLEFLSSTNKWTAVNEASLGWGPTYYLVGPAASKAPFTSIQSAINQAITDNGGVERTSTTPAVVMVLPGVYTENVTLKKHVHVVAINGGINTFSTWLVGTVTCNLTLEGSGKLSTYVYWDGVSIQNSPSAPAVTFSGSNSQKLFLKNMNYGGTSSFLLMSNTGTIGANGPSQVQCENVNITTLANTAYGIRLNAGQLYFHQGQIQNSTTLAGVSPVVLDITSAAGAFPIYYEVTQTQIVGRINIDASASTLVTPGSIYGTVGLCSIQASVTGTPSTAIVSTRAAAAANVSAFNFFDNSFFPSTWSATTVAPIRGTVGVATVVFARGNKWILPGGNTPTQLCDGTFATYAGVPIVDPSGVTAGTYPSAGGVPSVTVDSTGRVTAASNLLASTLTGLNATNITTGTLPTAQLPIIPKNKGGFGQDVSVGLTNGNVAVVSGGQITIGPPPASPSNVMLACLSDPFFNNTQWYSGQFISVDSSNKSYSTSFWSNIGSYTPSAASETLSKFTVNLGAGAVSVLSHISVWRRPLGGVEYDTGIVITLDPMVPNGLSFSQNLVDTLVMNAGDEIKFTTDTYIGVQNVMIYATRQ